MFQNSKIVMQYLSPQPLKNTTMVMRIEVKKYKQIQIDSITQEMIHIFSTFGEIQYNKQKVKKSKAYIFFMLDKKFQTTKACRFLQSVTINDKLQVTLYQSNTQQYLRYLKYIFDQNISLKFQERISPSQFVETKKQNQKENNKNTVITSKSYTQKLENQSTLDTIKEEKKSFVSHKIYNCCQLKQGFNFKQSRVIFVSNLEDYFTNIIQIFNVYCQYGDIEKIIFFQNLHKCLIQFKKQKYAKRLVENPEKFQILKSSFKYQYSKFDTIDLNKQKETNKFSIYNQYAQFSQNFHLFDIGILKRVRTQSSLLQVPIFQLDKQERYSFIQMIQYIIRDYQINPVEIVQNKQFLHVQCESELAAFQIQKNLNNFQLNNKSLRVFFQDK